MSDYSMKVYFKSWTGSIEGVPPVNGGGGGGESCALNGHDVRSLNLSQTTGYVRNVLARRVSLSDVDTPVALHQDYGVTSSCVVS